MLGKPPHGFIMYNFWDKIINQYDDNIIAIYNTELYQNIEFAIDNDFGGDLMFQQLYNMTE